MDSNTVAALAIAWWQDFMAVATTHPVLSTFALIVALVSLLLSRSLMLFIAAIFLCVAAVFGSEPVDDPLKRQAFATGCLCAVLIVSFVAMGLRLKARALRSELKAAQEREAQISARLEDEVRWRRAAGDDERERRPEPA